MDDIERKLWADFAIPCRCGAALFTGADTMPDMNVAPVLGVPGVLMLRGTCYRCGVELSSKPMHAPTVRWCFA